MFLIAEPHITGVILSASVARRIAARSSSTEMGSSLMNFSASMSSTSATSWMISSRAPWRLARRTRPGSSSSRMISPSVAVEEERLADDRVDDARELVLGAHRHLELDRVVAELLLEHVRDALVVGARVVHLVDERDARHAVALHLLVDGDRLALHALARVEHEDRAVEHAERALDLDGEVDVAGRVDDVDVVRLRAAPASPFHTQYVAADWMVMPFSRSRSIESILAPTPSLPRTSWILWMRPV